MIGCGAAAANLHLPALTAVDGIEVAGLADTTLKRAERLGRRYGIGRVATDYRELALAIDAAVVALPHHLHAPVAIDLLSRGIHVLVEKPMATSSAECEEMIRASAASGAILAVGLVRRFFNPYRFIHRLAADGSALGRPLRFEIREGGVYDWPVASGFAFGGGGGVLQDLGVHVLDLLSWWFGDCESVECRDDARGGAEAEAELELRFERDVEGAVSLTRIRNIPNVCRVEFERGTIELPGGADPAARLRVELSGGDAVLGAPVLAGEDAPPDQAPDDNHSVFRRQAEDFAAAVAGHAAPRVTGVEGKRSVELLERCRPGRRSLAHPWWVPAARDSTIGAPGRGEAAPGPTAADAPPRRTARPWCAAIELAPELAGRRVLVTGGTGFIGGRVAETLALGCGAAVRVLVRDFRSAPRIARCPVELVPGDVTAPREVARAAEGCDLLVHCAYGSVGHEAERGRVNVDGTRNVLEAARERGARRVVHLSTVMVYGELPDGRLDESMPRRRTGEAYGDTKLEAERLATDFGRHGDVEVAVIQPTAVYGPWAPVWTTNVLRDLTTGRVILVNGGKGLANPVYVDDVVQAVLLAAARREAAGEAFLIAGPDRVTWREFYSGFEGMLGMERTVSMSEDEALEYSAAAAPGPDRPHRLPGEIGRLLWGTQEARRRLRRTPELRAAIRAGRAVVPEAAKRFLKEHLAPRAPSRAERGHPGTSIADRRAGRVRAGPAADPGRAAEDTVPSADSADAVHPLSPSAICFFAARTEVTSGKAEGLLGYRPCVGFGEGLRPTAQWARWAHLLAGSGAGD